MGHRRKRGRKSRLSEERVHLLGATTDGEATEAKRSTMAATWTPDEDIGQFLDWDYTAAPLWVLVPRPEGGIPSLEVFIWGVQ
jgi:hypothetical protein